VLAHRKQLAAGGPVIRHGSPRLLCLPYTVFS
jgi:hypothetical protein